MSGTAMQFWQLRRFGGRRRGPSANARQGLQSILLINNEFKNAVNAVMQHERAQRAGRKLHAQTAARPRHDGRGRSAVEPDIFIGVDMQIDNQPAGRLSHWSAPSPPRRAADSAECIE